MDLSTQIINYKGKIIFIQNEIMPLHITELREEVATQIFK